MLTLNTKQKEFVDAAKKMYNKSTLSNNELKKVAKSLKVGFPQWLNRNPELRVGRGKYKLPLDGLPVVETSTQKTTSNNSEVLSDTKSETKAVDNTTTKEAAYVISSLSGDTVSYTHLTLPTSG